MQFHGEFQHRVDPQGRIAIPARYREAFTGGIYITRGFDQCVWVFSPEEWDTYSSRYAAMSPNSRVARTLRRRVFGSTFDLELDRQGRVVVPAGLRQHAAIAEEVVIIGQDTYLEVWSRDRWREQEAQEANLAEIAEGLEAANG
ncbi:MAG: division/cell wall cluster transcriptional repressor MraZ [Chloroflexi bacterium]|nr:division/cell wall cluster transcriptional repressor MraZ [Chloroflexota bacterium]